MGMLWSFFNPVLMLAVYTLVFSVIFKARWPGGTESKTEFALVLFSGLMVFNLFAECLNKAPTLILGNVNYVKKVIFPLEILPIVSLGAALFHFVISFIVWVTFYLVFFGVPNPTVLLLPVIIVPLMLITMGISWVFASLGVFMKDVGQFIGVITTLLLFLSPIFYPLAALPEEYHPLMQMNPLTNIVEQTRDVMIWGKSIDWLDWALQTVLSALVAWLGFAWFQKTRKGFADVL
jgi:lipopolysaccharide transport system permease protein